MNKILIGTFALLLSGSALASGNPNNGNNGNDGTNGNAGSGSSTDIGSGATSTTGNSISVSTHNSSKSNSSAVSRSISNASGGSSIAIGGGLGETYDNRQPYSDDHLFSVPNSFGGFSMIVKPKILPVAPGVEVRDGQVFVDGTSKSCDQAQRGGLPKCFEIGK